ncbi:MAG TPA: 2-oxoglutarate dehydrogenase complex dihydrolipoyllysine-residue succinyltransferase [Alphaproteobacteria bacterium]|nr:2-oxoglutarate dehydrogenase complex dihydrolipoyllysine-residue succinyltransferase [Alphaproteobacteria bacterium]
MATNIVVPTLGESVTEATVSKWFKKVGEAIAADDPLVELETDKVTLEVPAPAAGTLGEIRVAEGGTVAVGATLGVIADGGAPAKPAAAEKPQAKPASPPTPAAKPMAAPQQAAPPPSATSATADVLAPAVRKLVDDNALDSSQIPATGKDGRLTKGDVLAYLETRRKPAPAPTVAPAPPPPQPTAPTAPPLARPGATMPREERVRMSRLRRTIAQRLKEAQNTAAMLTTFNEADMSAVIAVRGQYREIFEKKHGVRLGFMSFFAKACIVALKEVPSVNAQIDGEDLVYKNHYDLGIAIGGGQGLVVPVLLDADQLSFAQIEKAIADFGRRARDGKLALEELSGGTFTITNGGIYGSLNSTPILNPPQSAILGMHKIQERPVAVGGKVEVRPMMYLALSYDHRVVDGREAVTFLVRVKECIEDPQRILLDM